MTDLLSRPTATSSTGGPLGRLLRRPAGGDGSQTRSLTVGAALAAAGAYALTMLGCLAVAVVGWFSADAGAHGQTTDALRVGAQVWLVGHGSGITVRGVPLGIVPLALTALFAVVLWRLGRRAALTSAPPEDDRAVVLAVTVHTGIHVVLTVLTTVLVAGETASPGVGRAVLGSLLLSGAFGGLGMASGTGRLNTWYHRVPGFVRAVLHGAATGFLLLVAAAALLTAVMVVMGLNRAGTMMSQLHLGTGDHLMLTLATVAVVPNAVLLAAAYLLGPGFAVGTGTVVSPSLVSLGQVPAFPLLAALPDPGATPRWALALLAAPVLAGAAGAAMAQRAYGVTAYDSAALRGFGSGLGAALVTTVAIALAGGPMGTGRMADIGAPVGEVLVAAVAAMSLGGLAAGLVTAWWQRRRAHRAGA
jgi:hypothetical protein